MLERIRITTVSAFNSSSGPEKRRPRAAYQDVATFIALYRAAVARIGRSSDDYGHDSSDLGGIGV